MAHLSRVTNAPAYQTSGQTVIQRSTYSLAGQAIAVRVAEDPIAVNNGLFYLYSDHLGSASALVDSGGQKVNETRYLPFGGYRSGGPNTITDRGFTGHKENMTDLGLIYMNARFYAPNTNRFLTPDSIVPDPANPQSWNRYTYALNNPLRYSDPTGHLSEDEVEDYFGFGSRQEMLDAGWIEDLVNWLWDPDITWGDIFTYNDASEAMLTLFEAVEQDSGLYRGGFWGLNGDNRGEEVYAYEIESLDDRTQAATSLEEAFFNNWESLPRQTGSDGYNNYDPTTYVGALTVGTVSASASIGGLFFISGPAGWIAGGITIIGGGTAIYQAATDNLTHNYPVLRLPSLWGNAPRTLHAFSPRGLYK